MVNARVLILSDQEESAGVWSHALQRRGIQADLADLVPGSLQHFCSIRNYDLCIMDINEQDADGVVMCRSIRYAFDNPLLLLTYEQDERIHLQLYREGADECVVKPIGPVLLLAKIVAWLRRSSSVDPTLSIVGHGDFHLEPDLRSLKTPNGDSIKLSNLESRLITVLLNNRGTIVPTESIVDQVWGAYGEGDSTLLKRLVYRLRRKIEPDPKSPRYIESIPGTGYRFRSQ
jgi:DNA-binding response OmpR family regulator